MKKYFLSILMLMCIFSISFAQEQLSITSPTVGQTFYIPAGQLTMDITVSWTYHTDSSNVWFVLRADGHTYSNITSPYTVHNVSYGSKTWVLYMNYRYSGYTQTQVQFNVELTSVNIIADNNFTDNSVQGTHGSIIVDGGTYTAPFPFQRNRGTNVTLEAVSPQTDNQGYHRVWYTGSPDPSEWQRNFVNISYNQTYSFPVSSSDNGTTYQAQLRQVLPARIAYIYQDPDPLYNGGTGYVYAQISQGINITYSWYASYSPSNMTFHFTPQGNRCQVDYYIPYNTLPTINLMCVASNAGGTDVKSYQLHCALYGYGPASLAFAKNGTLIDENPVLVSSVDNPGVDVTDYYLINKEITPENQIDGKAGNAVNFSIHERDQAKGNTDLDQIELWEVKANPNEFIAVTEEGEVISYKKLATPNQIILNDSLDITNILADKDELKLTVKKGDRIKIKHKENAEGLYSVMYAQMYNEEGLSAVNNNSSDSYYFRPQSSAVCKKLKVIPVGDIEIDFSKDVILDYFALVKNEKTAKVEKLSLLSAEHSKTGEIASLFATADKQYGEIFPGEEIKFKYETKLNSNNDNAAYILKTVGRYEKAGLPKEGNLETISVLPKGTTLYDNYPNPFNPTAKISFSLPQKSQIKLKVFDVLGREIQILADGVYEAGKHEVEFNATNLPSGVYFYNLTTGTNSITKKMLLLR